MSKIAEKIYFEDDMLIVKKTFDANVMLEDARYARDKIGEDKFASDYKLVGTIAIPLLGVWLKEAGVSWTDTPAVKEVIKRKMMSNEFGGLRVWEGAY